MIRSLKTDVIALNLGAAMIIFSFGMFLALLSHHRKSLTQPKVQTLVLRLSLIFPAFSIIFFCTVVQPRYWSVFETAQSLVEGYLIYCYFRFMLFGIGGWNEAVNCMKDAPLNLMVVFQRNKPNFYLRLCDFMQIQFCTVRPFLYVILAAFDLGVKHSSWIVKTIEILAFIDLTLTMGFLLTFYEALRIKVIAFRPTKRIIAIKGLLFVISLGNVVGTHYSAGRGDEYILNFRRLFAIAIMGEVFVLSIFTFYFFGLNDPIGSDVKTEMSYFELLCDVLAFHKGLYPDDRDIPLLSKHAAGDMEDGEKYDEKSGMKYSTEVLLE